MEIFLKLAKGGYNDVDRLFKKSFFFHVPMDFLVFISMTRVRIIETFRQFSACLFKFQGFVAAQLKVAQIRKLFAVRARGPVE